jgi:hypothetical protein
MYLNTTYKAFVAQAASKLMAEIVGLRILDGSIDPTASFKDNEQKYEHLAIQATLAAKTLAHELQDMWVGEDRTTVFFDVQDSPTSRLENELANIGEKLEDIQDEIKILNASV